MTLLARARMESTLLRQKNVHLQRNPQESRHQAQNNYNFERQEPGHGRKQRCETGLLVLIKKDRHAVLTLVAVAPPSRSASRLMFSPDAFLARRTVILTRYGSQCQQRTHSNASCFRGRVLCHMRRLVGPPGLPTPQPSDHFPPIPVL